MGAGGGEGAARGGARGGRYTAADLSALRAVSVQGSFRASGAAGPGDAALEDEFPAPAPLQPGGEPVEVPAEGGAGGAAGTSIPGPAEVAAARARRQELRRREAEEAGYIPISGVAAGTRQKPSGADAAAGEGGYSGGDGALWAAEQARKGASAGWGGEASNRLQALRLSAPPPERVSGPKVWKAAADRSREAVVEAYRKLEERAEQLEARRRDAGRVLQQSQVEAEGLRAALGERRESFAFLQELRTFLGDLCACLEAKRDILDALERRADSLAEQRQRDASAGNALFSGGVEAAAMEALGAGVTAAMQALLAGKNAEGASRAAELAIGQAEAAACGAGVAPLETDEFGRDTNLEGSQRAREALEGWKARAARATALDVGSWAEAECPHEQAERAVQKDAEGGAALLLPGETPTTEKAYALSRGELEVSAATVMADADEKFSSAAAVYDRLMEWEAREPQSFERAGARESTRKLYAFYLRLELLRSDLSHSGAALKPGLPDSMEWYRALAGPPDQEDGKGPAPPRASRSALPGLLRHVLLPRLQRLVQEYWLPDSVPQTEALLGFAGAFRCHLPEDSEELCEFMLAAEERLIAAAEAATVPVWPRAACAATPGCAAAQALLLDRNVRLLRNLGRSCGALAPEERLIDAALGGVLDRGTLPYLHMLLFDPPAAVQAAVRVTHALRPAWRAGPGGRLDKFREFLRSVDQKLVEPKWEALRAPLRRAQQHLEKA